LVERKYTPTSVVDLKGEFDLLIKIYRANVHPKFVDGGKLTSWMENLQIGDKITISGPRGKLTYKGNGKIEIDDGGNIT